MLILPYYLNKKGPKAILIGWVLAVVLILAGPTYGRANSWRHRSPHNDSQAAGGVNCRNCHLQKPSSSVLDAEQIQANLKPEYSQRCYKCHADKVPQSCRLSSSTKISTILISQIPDFPLPLFQNKISCLSCHIIHQKPAKGANHSFLLRKAYSSFLKAAENIDPHKSGVFCVFCHEKEPRSGDKEVHLRFGGDAVQLCKDCHNNKRARADNHPVGIVPSNKRGVKVPEAFPLTNGKLTCISCHKLACQGKTDNLFFLRGGPYQKRIDTCLVCHVKEQYEKVNPHDQISETGEIREDRCLFCHDINKENSTGLAFKFKAPFKFYCLGCHPINIKKHPFGAYHTGRQLDAIWEGLKPLERIKLSQQEKFKMFPISLSGKIMCTTCHNPHDVRKGSKLRINNVNKSCRQCHYKKYGQIIQTEAVGTGQWRSKEQAPAPLQETPSQNDLDPKHEDKVPFGYRASLNYYCIGCHADQATNHPYGVMHTGKFIKRFWKSKFRPKNGSIGAGNGLKAKSNFIGDSLDRQILPLTLSGQIGCFTCHDPHNGAKGPKLRVESKERLCNLCHPNRSGIIKKYLQGVAKQPE